MKVAIFSPQKNAFSETFIKAHREFLSGEILYYYGNFIPYLLNNKKTSKGVNKILFRLLGRVLYKRPFYDIERALIKSLKDQKVDIILIEYGLTAAESIKVLKEAQIPFVVHFHGYDAFRYDVIEKYQKIYKEVFDSSSGIISVSSLMTKELIKLGCDKSKILYNPYGPNNIFLETRPLYESEQIITVGRFTEKKAPQLVIFSFYLIAEKFPNSRLVMVGDGPLFNICEELIHSLNLTERIILTGVRNPNEVKELMGKSSIYLQHSVRSMDGDCEGTPVAILEAMAAGLPVISTSHSGISDVVKDGETGFLVNEGAVNLMAKKLEQTLGNTELRKNMGTKGREIIKSKYLMKYHIRTLDEFFFKIVENNKMT